MPWLPSMLKPTDPSMPRSSYGGGIASKDTVILLDDVPLED